jgi:hypothetical protein
MVKVVVDRTVDAAANGLKLHGCFRRVLGNKGGRRRKRMPPGELERFVKPLICA